MPYLLDTCALSEFLVKAPHPKAVARLRTLPAEETFIPSLAIGEIKQGIDQLADAQRRSELEAWLFNQLLPSYSDRMIPFDREEALRWGQLRAQMRAGGTTMATEDSIIAATALTHDLTLVTCNESAFARCGVKIFNPWK